MVAAPRSAPSGGGAGRERQVQIDGARCAHAAVAGAGCEARVPGLTSSKPYLPGLLRRGEHSSDQLEQYLGFLAFIGNLALFTGRAILRPWRIRWDQVVKELQAAGVNALPIVGLLTFLIGIVIAYQGGMVLRDYGANLYVADIVGLSMVRELAPLITAIIVAGRTGSAYTAQIGTMMVTEEVDALRSMGISPLEMLVLPKLIALLVALPLLTVFADALGLFGGLIMANVMLDLNRPPFSAGWQKPDGWIVPERYWQGAGVCRHHCGGGLFQGFQVRAAPAALDGRRRSAWSNRFSWSSSWMRPFPWRLQNWAFESWKLRTVSAIIPMNRPRVDNRPRMGHLLGGLVLEGCELAMSFGAKRVFEGVNVRIRQGEVLAIVGGSGSGKSTLMRQLALLQTPTSGSVTVFGTTVTDMESSSANSLRRRLGVMFQNGALFGDLTVLENVSVPLQEHTDLSLPLIEQVAMLKIALAGLEPEAAALYPSQLSGGMRKRAAVARGIALDPAVLFLDEQFGLDRSCRAMDELVVQLKETLGLAVCWSRRHGLWRLQIGSVVV
jgi:ABC transport permease subunit